MQPTVVQSGSIRALNVLGITHHLVLTGDQTGAALLVLDMPLADGAGIPLHVHTREDEVFHIAEGRIVFTIGDRETTLGPGATVFGPRHTPHAFQAQGPARMLVTIAPAGMEAMLEELSRLPAGPPDLARVGEIVGRYGISFV